MGRSMRTSGGSRNPCPSDLPIPPDARSEALRTCNCEFLRMKDRLIHIRRFGMQDAAAAQLLHGKPGMLMLDAYGSRNSHHTCVSTEKSARFFGSKPTWGASDQDLSRQVQPLPSSVS